MLLTTIALPAKSFDMSCLNFWFWGVRKSRPSTLTVLKAVVDAFVESIHPGEVKRPARSTRDCARVCRGVAGASFEGGLKKILKGPEY